MASDACLSSKRAFLRGVVDVDGDDGESHGERRVGDDEDGKRASEGRERDASDRDCTRRVGVTRLDRRPLACCSLH